MYKTSTLVNKCLHFVTKMQYFFLLDTTPKSVNIARMNTEDGLNIGFFTILLVIGAALVPFGIGIFIILYAFGYLFTSLFGKK